MLGRLHQVLLPVEDLDEAREFYEHVLGLPFIAAFDPPTALALLAVVRAAVLLADEPEDPQSWGGLYESVDALFEEADDDNG